MFVDGAYFREIILNELTPADWIYVARPINYQCARSLPTNYADLEDFKTKLNFNGTYDGERHQIHLINKLFKDKALKRTEPDQELSAAGRPLRPEEGWKRGLSPHQLDRDRNQIPRGYLDYVFEDMAVFDRAHEEALRKFRSPEAEASFRITTSPPTLLPAGRLRWARRLVHRLVRVQESSMKRLLPTLYLRLVPRELQARRGRGSLGPGRGRARGGEVDHRRRRSADTSGSWRRT